LNSCTVPKPDFSSYRLMVPHFIDGLTILYFSDLTINYP
jgi:hypothetical protein